MANECNTFTNNESRLCLGVTHPHSSGIGGGAFVVLRLANGTSEAIDSREAAPAAAYRDMFIDGSKTESGANRSR